MAEEQQRKPRGVLYGEDHPKARVSDAEVELIHQLAEAGLSPRDIARKLDDYDPPVSWITVRDIVRGRRRARPGSGRRTPQP